MKALSVVEPYGDYITSGRKTLEIRSWTPDLLPLRDVLIVQTKHRLSLPDEQAKGVALCVVDIEDVRPWESCELEQACVDSYAVGYHAWHIANVRAVGTPVSMPAKRKFYEVSPEDEDKICSQLRQFSSTEGNKAYWDYLERIISSHEIVIESKKGCPHRRYPDRIYPLDYGYIKDTTTCDEGGIDIFVGSLTGTSIQGILCTVDTLKNDSEIKILYNCSDTEIRTAERFLNSGYMRAMLVRRTNVKAG